MTPAEHEKFQYLIILGLLVAREGHRDEGAAPRRPVELLEERQLLLRLAEA
jgi:hypothetical protein